MNRFRNIFACLCPALLLTFGQGHAATILWSDNFETNAASRWTSTGVWQIGTPTKGPSGAHSPVNCASTQNYPYSQYGQLICTNYLNGSNSLVIPPASVFPTLTFWHWLNFKSALGYVELKSGTNGWQQISPTYLDFTSGGLWVQSTFDLSAFEGQSVQLAFFFSSGPCCGNAQGWYVDDVSLTAVVPAPDLFVPDTQLIYAGETLNATCSATNSFLPDATYTFQLLSAPAGVSMTTNGELTWATTLSQPSSTNTISVQVTDNNAPSLSTNKSFLVVVLNQYLPILTVPAKQTMYAGQTLTVTNHASSVYRPNTTFTFELVSGPTSMDVSTNGVLSYSPPATQPETNYTATIKVRDNNPPYFSATQSFVIVVSNAPAPTLKVPTNQVIYAGQTLIVTNYATNVYGTNSTFTFALLSVPPTEANMDTNTGVLSWETLTNLQAGKYTNIITVQDSMSHRSATNRFVITVSNAPAPILKVPTNQVIYAGQTLNFISSATSVYPNSIFTFQLLSIPEPGMETSDLTNNGVLRWATTNGQPAKNYTAKITVWDSVSQRSATNSFVIALSNAPAPTLKVPTNQVIYAGQTLSFTNSATSVYGTNSTFTFGWVPVPPTSMDVSDLTNNGVLRWATTNGQPVGKYTNTITVLDSVSQRSATKSFVITVSNAPPPTLTVPPTQRVYAGQTLIVTNIIATSVFPNPTFTFALLTFSPPPGLNLDTNTGVLRWETKTNQPAGNYTIFIEVVDNLSQLPAIKSFVITVATNAPTPPTLHVLPTQPGFATNGFRFTFTTSSNAAWRIDASTNLLNWHPVSTNIADTNGTLQFTDLLATNFLHRFYRAVSP